MASGCPALAAETSTRQGVITRGPLSFQPLLRTEITQDDNIFESKDNEVDSLVTRIAPSFTTRINAGGRQFELAYNGEFGQYADSPSDDYDDHAFSAEAELNLGWRSRLNLFATYDLGHQDRGTGLTENFDPLNPPIAEPDELTTTELVSEYIFGSPGSTGRIELAAGLQNVEYQNRRERTQYRDRNNTVAGATFFYRVLPATSLLFEVRANDISYDVNEPGTASLENKELRYLFGAAWEITDLTTGIIKLGQVEKKFDDPARKDFSGFDWEAELRYSLRSYSHFDLQAARDEEETNGDGNFIDVLSFSLGWTHGWTDSIQTLLQVAHYDATYEGVGRDQEVFEYGVSLNYQWRRWLSVALAADFSELESNIDSFEFTRSNYRISANISL
ncbi:MAG: outer membrane beta-barrel protein [Pseudomonadales bacterium]|nr:outer membrane beta-barrel protein [Pseudomonadales bacterium]